MSNITPVKIKLLAYRSLSTLADSGVTFMNTSVKWLELYPSETLKLGFSLWFPGRAVGGSLRMDPLILDHGISIHMEDRQFEVPVCSTSLPQWIASFEFDGNTTIFIPIDKDAPEPKKMHRFENRNMTSEKLEQVRSSLRSRHHVIHVGQPARKPPPNTEGRELLTLAA